MSMIQILNNNKTIEINNKYINSISESYCLVIDFLEILYKESNDDTLFITYQTLKTYYDGLHHPISNSKEKYYKNDYFILGYKIFEKFISLIRKNRNILLKTFIALEQTNKEDALDIIDTIIAELGIICFNAKKYNSDIVLANKEIWSNIDNI